MILQKKFLKLKKEDFNKKKYNKHTQKVLKFKIRYN